MKVKLYIIATFLLLMGLSNSLANYFDSDLFRVFPNPVVDNAITIEAEYNFHKIEILSIVGQIVHSEELEPSNSVRLSINLQPGVYLIRVIFSDQISNTKRIWVN